MDALRKDINTNVGSSEPKILVQSGARDEEIDS